MLRFVIEKVRCFTLFATHFHDLGNLEKCYPKIVSNVHVKAMILEKEEAQASEVSLLYKVVPGVGHESLGIHVAHVVGFPTESIKVLYYFTSNRKIAKKKLHPPTGEVSQITKFMEFVKNERNNENTLFNEVVNVYSDLDPAFMPQVGMFVE